MNSRHLNTVNCCSKPSSPQKDFRSWAKIRGDHMNPIQPTDITARLMSWCKGDQQALADVIPLVYDDLRQIARKQLGRSPSPNIQSGSLAHEAYLKLVNVRGIQCNNRGHF